MIPPDEFLSLLAMCIPILAIVGGISLAIIRMLGQMRLAELARRERIAAIERGVDPDKLPPLAPGLDDWAGPGGGYHPLRRAQGLMIGGLVLLAIGVSGGIFLRMIARNDPAWALGLVPTFVGIALMVSSALVWPKKG